MFEFVLLYICSLVVALPCTSADYHGEYTVCRTTNSGLTRNVLFAWNYDSACDPQESGSVALPPNIYGLKCDVVCASGLYLPVGASNCSECQAGTISLGGGVLVSQWDSWPDGLQFTTRCEENHGELYKPGVPTSKCSGWELRKWNVRSGNVTDLQSSVVELRVSLVRPGSVSFNYFVSAEVGFDGLIFFIDNANVADGVDESQVALPLVSSTPLVTSFAANLSVGTHVLTWKFFKDFTSSEGQDMAFFKDLKIIGTSYADEYCSVWPFSFALVRFSISTRRCAIARRRFSCSRVLSASLPAPAGSACAYRVPRTRIRTVQAPRSARRATRRPSSRTPARRPARSVNRARPTATNACLAAACSMPPRPTVVRVRYPIAGSCR
jgi:hypothetical protein